MKSFFSTNSILEHPVTESPFSYNVLAFNGGSTITSVIPLGGYCYCVDYNREDYPVHYLDPELCLGTPAIPGTIKTCWEIWEPRQTLLRPDILGLIDCVHAAGTPFFYYSSVKTSAVLLPKENYTVAVIAPAAVIQPRLLTLACKANSLEQYLIPA